MTSPSISGEKSYRLRFILDIMFIVFRFFCGYVGFEPKILVTCGTPTNALCILPLVHNLVVGAAGVTPTLIQIYSLFFVVLICCIHSCQNIVLPF